MSQVSEIFSKEHIFLDKNEETEIKEKKRSISIDSLQYSEESINLPIDNQIFIEELIPSQNIKNEFNNLNDSSNYCLFLENPSDECVFTLKNTYSENTVASIDNSSDELIESSDELIESSSRPNKKIKLNRCKGCYPVFQLNQEGHMGKNGCLGDYYDFISKN